MTVHF